MALLKDEIALIDITKLPKDVCLLIFGYSRKDWRTPYAAIMRSIISMKDVLCPDRTFGQGCLFIRRFPGGMELAYGQTRNLKPVRQLWGPTRPMCSKCKEHWTSRVAPILAFAGHRLQPARDIYQAIPYWGPKGMRYIHLFDLEKFADKMRGITNAKHNRR